MTRWLRGALPLLLLLSGWSVSAQEWVPFRSGDPLPRALMAGRDIDGSPTYVIRSRFQGGLVVGKYVLNSQTAYVPWGGKEYVVPSGEVYVGGGVWRPMAAGDPLPEGAVTGGSEPGGQPLFVIRAAHDNAVVPGKYSALTGKGYIPFGGREWELNSWEILVRAEPEETGPVAELIRIVRSNDPRLPVFPLGMADSAGSASGQLSPQDFHWEGRAVNAFSLPLRRGQTVLVAINGGPEKRAEDFELFLVNPTGHATGAVRVRGGTLELEAHAVYEGPYTLLVVQRGPRGLGRYFLTVRTSLGGG